MARKKQPERAKRRAPSTGSIRYRKGRALPYEAAFPLGDGQHRHKSFALRPEATAFLDRLTAERDSLEAPRNIAGGSQLVRTFLCAWIETKRGRVRAKTFAAYCYYCELAIGQIGGYRLDEVSREKADGLLTYFHDKHYQNIDQIRATMCQAFEYAVEAEYIRKNHWKKTKAPTVVRREPVVLTQAQRNILLRAAAGTPLCALWHLYSRVGLRRGEGLGLRWQDIDWERGTITITQTYTELNGKLLKSIPKTPRSERTIPIPPNLLDILRRHHDERHARALPGDLVFPGPDGQPWLPSKVLYQFKKLLKRAGLPPMTIHHLRHTAEYLMEQGGAPLSVRMALLGHATPDMASHYSDHAALEAMRRTVGSIA